METPIALAKEEGRLFETTDALSLIILWIVFGYLTVLLNCDLQRLMLKNPMFLHVMALIVFFFLFTTLDPNNTGDFGMLVVKTLFVYVVFILITKSKWYFALPVILLLLVDQLLKRWEALSGTEPSERITQNQWYIYTSRGLISLLVALGTLDYARIQKLEYGKKFSWYTFFFGLSNQCKK